MLSDTLQPGSPVPVEGVYRVHHYRHRLAHLARVKFLRFPECDKCGDQVRFEALLILESCPLAPYLKDDQDFQKSTVGIPRKADTLEGGKSGSVDKSSGPPPFAQQ